VNRAGLFTVKTEGCAPMRLPPPPPDVREHLHPYAGGSGERAGFRVIVANACD
jgi:hypothetical protein